jgi:predicted anti-sigma-YlaC factor YlaD
MSARAVALAGPPARARRWLTAYLWLVMGVLLVQGSGSLALRLWPDLAAATPPPLATLMNGNEPHAALHTAWGAVGLLALALWRSDRARLGLALVFGTFYTLLGILGVIVVHPAGMRLDAPENVFHLTVGPLMLALAWRAVAGAGAGGRGVP